MPERAVFPTRIATSLISGENAETDNLLKRYKIILVGKKLEIKF